MPIDHPYRICLMRGRGFISQMIRWQTRCQYSHAALHIGERYVIEAWQGAGVRLHRLDSFNDVDLFVNQSMERRDWERVEKLMRGQLGKAYDYGAVLRFLTRHKDSDAANDKWFCFELMAWAMESAGFPVAMILPSRVHGGHFEACPNLIKVDR